MKKFSISIGVITIFILATLVGGLAVHIAQNSQNDEILEYVSTSLRRVVVVENIDFQRGVIGVRAVDREIGGSERFILTVDEGTTVFAQEPIFTEGVVTGFSPLQALPIQELAHGSQVLAHIQILGDGRLRAGSIIVRSPFTGN